MCGRIAQFSAWQSYVEALGLALRQADASAAPRPRYNVGPGTRVLTIDGAGDALPIWWGYRPHWAVTRNVPPMINARADRITSATWKPLLRVGRVIVPADNWYEWVVDTDGRKQPYLLRARHGEPLFLAGLCSVKPAHPDGPRDPTQGPGMVDGVVIVTDASDRGMVDVHDRRPVALSAADARLWLDGDTTLELAAELACTAARPVEAFEWYKVSRDVNRIGHDAPALVEPIAEA